MKKLVRALACCALISSLAACVVTPPPRSSTPAPARPSARELGIQRYRQVNERIDYLNRRIDARVNSGVYPPPDAAPLRHRLDVIRREARDMAGQHGGGVSEEEQRVLNHELDSAARAIGG